MKLIDHEMILLAATMWVYPDFFVYRNGIYRRSNYGDNEAKGFHSVRLVGWGEESFGYSTTKYWVRWTDINFQTILESFHKS